MARQAETLEIDMEPNRWPKTAVDSAVGLAGLARSRFAKAIQDVSPAFWPERQYRNYQHHKK
jgi:hypothetical protein